MSWLSKAVKKAKKVAKFGGKVLLATTVPVSNVKSVSLKKGVVVNAPFVGKKINALASFGTTAAATAFTGGAVGAAMAGSSMFGIHTPTGTVSSGSDWFSGLAGTINKAGKFAENLANAFGQFSGGGSPGVNADSPAAQGAAPNEASGMSKAMPWLLIGGGLLVVYMLARRR